MGRKRETARVPVALYRLKASVLKDPFAGILPNEKRKETSIFDVDLGEESTSKILVRSTDPKYPRWAKFLLALEGDLKDSLEEYASNGAALVVRGGVRYALVFGQGRVLIEPDCVERGFGLRCALDMVAEQSLVGVDLRDVGPTTLYSRIQANKAGTFSQFRVDTEATLLNGVSGHAEPPHEYYSKAEGLDALHVNPRLTPKKILPFLDFIEKVYSGGGYLKKGFDWVDNISSVRDPKLEDDLIALMDANLAAKNSSVRFGPPEYIDHREVSGFRVVGMRKGREDTITAGLIKKARGEKTLTAEILRDAKIVALDSDETPAQTWRAWNWACWSTKHNKMNYVLHDGTFYAVEPSYERRIDDFIGTRLRRLAKSWPDWKVASPGDEAAYNAFMSKKLGSQAVLLDRKPFTKAFLGKGALELCDVFVKGKPAWLVCVKTYSGSSAPISHLIAQGANAAETLLEDPAFRKDVRKVASLRSYIPKESLDPSAIGVAFLILTEKKRRKLSALPFFSKLVLYRFAKQAKARGIEVRVGTRARGM